MKESWNFCVQQYGILKSLENLCLLGRRGKRGWRQMWSIWPCYLSRGHGACMTSSIHPLEIQTHFAQIEGQYRYPLKCFPMQKPIDPFLTFGPIMEENHKLLHCCCMSLNQVFCYRHRPKMEKSTNCITHLLSYASWPLHIHQELHDYNDPQSLPFVERNSPEIAVMRRNPRITDLSIVGSCMLQTWGINKQFFV